MSYDISGDIMFRNMEKLKIDSVLYGNASLLKTYTDRPTHGFVFKLSGQSRYTVGQTALLFPENTVLFLPQGADYTVQRLTDGESRYGLVNFRAELAAPGPRLYRPDDFSRAEAALEDMARLWLFPSEENHYACLSLFYRLLSIITRAEGTPGADPGRRKLLEPAIRYLETHIFDPELRTEKLAAMCGISDVYFRRLFGAEFGVSPKSYIIGKRLTQARTILRLGEYAHIYEVAEAVGYTDALYFSRAYKQRFGANPGER